MKKKLFVLTIVVALISACGGIKSTSRGLDNESYLTFVGNTTVYKSGVDVTIDENTNFIATVVKDKTRAVKGSTYAVSPGKLDKTEHADHPNSVL